MIKKAILAMFFASAVVNAQVITQNFGTGANAFSIDFVQIGNPGNVADTSADINPVGSVSYTYNIGKYEISREMIEKVNSEVNLSLTMSNMTGYGGNGANKPATGISWYEAAKFVNYLNTSKGYQAAYLFDGSGTFQVWSSVRASGNNLFRHKDAYYFLPSKDEMWKAAYGSPDGTWYNYPTGSDSAPTPVASGTTDNTAVYEQPNATGPADIANAGALSPYGTMAQGGNAYEWIETASDGINDTVGENRLLLGGYWGGADVMMDAHWSNYQGGPAAEYIFAGFRVASVPEPSALSLLAVGLGGLAMMRRRRA
jgi:formylglycine-generating enzyme required for sulfatase activity